MSGRSRILTWGLPALGTICLVAGAGMVIENRPVTPAESPPRQPTTSPDVAKGIDAGAYIGAIGTSEPPGEPIAIASHIPGVVTEVAAELGTFVEGGTPLFRIDDRTVRADVALRETAVRVARAELESTRASVPTSRADVDAARASLEAARADVDAALAERDDRANQERIASSIQDPRAIAAEELDRRRFALRQAEAALTTTRAKVLRAEADVSRAEAELARLVDPVTGVDGPTIVALASRVTQAEKDLERTLVDLERHTVRTPADAMILQVNVRVGEFAPAARVDEPLIVLGATGPLHLRVEVDEVDIPRFRADARAWASPRGEASTRVPLRFVRTEPLVVPRTTLGGRTSELVDTRVLEVVYELDLDDTGIGRQFDVYIEASEPNE